jgi:hypothetical protein
MNDAPDPIIGEVEAYRAFEVVNDHLDSVGLGAHRWTPGTNRARCHLAGKHLGSRTVWVNDPDDPTGLAEREEEALSAHGRIPAVNCSCGFYVFKDESACRAEFGEHPSVVIGRVLIWGRAIEHAEGYRAEHARITALITEDVAAIAPLLNTYGVEAVRPRTKAEEGLTTAYLVRVDGDTVKLDVPVRDSTEVIGVFTVAPGVEIPEPVARVTARFTPDRVITEFRSDPDDEDG